MLTSIFGLSLAATRTPSPELASQLAARMAAAVEALEAGAPVAVSAAARHDARRYVEARRRGALRLPAGTGRRCDASASALLQLTVDAPPLLRAPEQLVA